MFVLKSAFWLTKSLNNEGQGRLPTFVIGEDRRYIIIDIEKEPRRSGIFVISILGHAHKMAKYAGILLF